MKHTLAWQDGKEVKVKYRTCTQEHLQMMFSTFLQRKSLLMAEFSLSNNSKIVKENIIKTKLVQKISKK